MSLQNLFKNDVHYATEAVQGRMNEAQQLDQAPRGHAAMHTSSTHRVRKGLAVNRIAFSRFSVVGFDSPAFLLLLYETLEHFVGGSFSSSRLNCAFLRN